jgi:formamidopyrimidine-DNA glycosylase
VPELPEVELVRRSLLPIRGRRIEEVEVLLPSVLSSPFEDIKRAKGRKVKDIERRGKQIFLILEEGILTLHLGMTGETILGERAEVKHVAVRVRFDDGKYLNFIDQRRFGAFGYADSVRGFVATHHLGPDILIMHKDDLVSHLRRSRRPVKSILLDQSVTAGIGNLYADEALFQARLHPLRTGASLKEEEAARLWRMARKVIRRSLADQTDFDLLPASYLLPVREGRGPCPRCHGELQALVVGGRTSVFCPNCQVASE